MRLIASNMLNFFGGLFHQIGASIGVFFVVAGSMLGGVHAPEEVVATSSPIEIDVQTEAEGATTQKDMPASPAVSQFTKATNSSPVTPSTQTLEVSSPASQPETTLQIENVKTSVNNEVATISWTTTVPAESRLTYSNPNLVISDTVIESKSGFSTSHSVKFSGAIDNQEFKYKITATTEDKKGYDDFYGVISTPKKPVEVSLTKPILKVTGSAIRNGSAIEVTGTLSTLPAEVTAKLMESTLDMSGQTPKYTDPIDKGSLSVTKTGNKFTFSFPASEPVNIDGLSPVMRTGWIYVNYEGKTNYVVATEGQSLNLSIAP